MSAHALDAAALGGCPKHREFVRAETAILFFIFRMWRGVRYGGRCGLSVRRGNKWHSAEEGDQRQEKKRGREKRVAIG
jgi:hypothetical protein